MIKSFRKARQQFKKQQSLELYAFPFVLNIALGFILDTLVLQVFINCMYQNDEKKLQNKF